MSAPETRLLSDATASEIEAGTVRALSRRDELSEIARELALSALALLRDREARCELMAVSRASEYPQVEKGQPR